jgi:hypothetical protein
MFESESRFFEENHELLRAKYPDKELLVVCIGDRAFRRSYNLEGMPTSITIGKYVVMSDNYDASFPNNFYEFYKDTKQRAGKYTYSKNSWTYAP